MFMRFKSSMVQEGQRNSKPKLLEQLLVIGGNYCQSPFVLGTKREQYVYLRARHAG